ncbi:Mom family adenine methylcarbamoylation protein [Amycolatopsis samaneae]|uniref:Protein Mom n=1 Tax=Amycolatopsis samaneae TaxID=664691 RepID=A0ABW5GAW2_9PSEU
MPLLVAPCHWSAAKFAVLRWHYSEKMPVSKIAPFGVWEHGEFIGVIIFGRSATARLGNPYGLGQTECVELLRIALGDHEHPVTQMLTVALRQLRAACPGLRLIVSYADTAQGHHGGVYQAGSWIYTGTTSPHNASYVVHGKLVHGRTLRHLAVGRPAGETAEQFVRRTIDPEVRRVNDSRVKHRYLYPLTRRVRRAVTPLAKPYPRRSEPEQAKP